MDELGSRLRMWWAQFEATRLGTQVEEARWAWRRAVGRVRGRLRRLTGRTSDGWRRATAPARPAAQATTSAARRAADAARPGRPPILYRDGMITLDHHGVVISGYYLPFGRHRIPYERIHAVCEHPLTHGREFRLHGFTWPRYWYHRDAWRAERAVGLELRTDTWLWPVLTPAEVDEVKAIISERIATDERTD